MAPEPDPLDRCAACGRRIGRYVAVRGAGAVGHRITVLCCLRCGQRAHQEPDAVDAAIARRLLLTDAA